MPCATARNAMGNRSLLGPSNYVLAPSISHRPSTIPDPSPLTLLALRCSPPLWPLGSLSRILGYGHRSVACHSSFTPSITCDRGSDRVGIGPLPCPAPSDDIVSPRPVKAAASYRRFLASLVGILTTPAIATTTGESKRNRFNATRSTRQQQPLQTTGPNGRLISAGTNSTDTATQLARRIRFARRTRLRDLAPLIFHNH